MRPLAPLLSLLAVLLSACAGMQLHYATIDDLPPAWRPPADMARDDAPWHPDEASAIAPAIRGAVREMVDYFAAHPEAIAELEGDAVQCLIDANAGAIDTTWTEQANAAATHNLRALAAPYLARAVTAMTHDDFDGLLTLVPYAHQLLPQSNLTAQLIARCNAAAQGLDLESAMDCDYRRMVASRRLSTDDAYDLVMWAVTWTDAMAVPGLALPEGATEVMPAVWRFLATYPLPPAREFVNGAEDEAFYDLAYLATHIGYIPTGYGRHALYIEDAPWLYRFIRENFYPVMAMGELDLFAEFVDLLRQYGCDATNDVQVRDGTRYLMGLYRKAGKSWIAHRESYEEGDVEPYELVHKPWTAIAGIKRRRWDPAARGSYGAIFRARFPAPTANPSVKVP